MLRQKLAEDNPTVATYRSSLAGAHHNLAKLLSETGRSADAEGEYRKAIAISRSVTEEAPAVTQYLEYLANHHNNLGLLLAQKGRPTEAEAELREAIALRRKLVDENPTGVVLRAAWFKAMSTWAGCCRVWVRRGRPRPSTARQ